MYTVTIVVSVDGDTLEQAKENALEYFHNMTEVQDSEIVKE